MSEEELESEVQSVYANNTRFEPSVWDLKVLFGQLEQHDGKADVDWHTAVTIPWTQAKIFSYFLLANLAFHERVNGPISIPDEVRPPQPEPPSDEMEKENPNARAVYEVLTSIHSQVFG